MTDSQTVFVVDDEPAVRKAIRLMLLSAGHKVETFASATEFLEAYDPSRPGCLVSDVRMPGMDGMQLLRELAKRGELPVVMLSAHGDIPMAVAAIKVGAIDFLEKPADANLLRRKVASALAIDAEARRNKEERDEISNRLATLTARERQVLEYLIDSKSSRTIASILGTSHNTVRVQRTSVMKKMHADNVADLVKMRNMVESDAKK